jgi:hypothetical protein
LRLHVSGESGTLLGYRAPLLEGAAGTAQTIRLMRRLIDQALNDPHFIRFSIDLVRNVPAYNEFGEVSALFSWVQDNIRYTKDPVTKEKLYPPQELLKIRAGDCDDIAMLLGALAIALGYPARLVTVAADPSAPNEFSHVYTEVEAPAGSGNWIAVDAARPNSSLGLQPPMYFRKRAWSLTDDSYQDLKGGTRLRGLSGLRGLGDGVDWSTVLQQSIAETPQIIAAVSGQPTSARLPSGSMVSTGPGSPYASFMTPYTPGYATPAAGYGSPLQALSSDTFSSLLPWILVGLVGFSLLRKG